MEGRASRPFRAGTPDAPQAKVRERLTVRRGVRVGRSGFEF
jgi:hypothetical protein